MKERREDTRVDAKHDVAVTVVSSPEEHDLENQEFHCSTENISATGILLFVDRPVLEGSTLELQLKGEKPIGTCMHIGRVAWVKDVGPGEGYAVGVRFTETPEDALAAWAAIIEDKLSRAGN